MLSEMERTVTNKLTCNFSGLYPKRGIFCGRQKLEGFVWEEDALPSSHAPVVFLTNPCNFACFKAAIKSLPFSLRGQNFPFFLIFYPFFLSLIVLCQKLPFVVSNNRKGFWRAKLSRFHTKPSDFCNIQISIKSQPYTELV